MKNFRSLIDRGKLWVQANGRIYRIELKKNSAAQDSSAAAQDLIAPFNCKIVKLHVAAGAEVKAGDAVVSVEAMKMEYTYTSPRAGKISEIKVKEGQIVNEGTHFVAWY